jgi:hypothetical protein
MVEKFSKENLREQVHEAFQRIFEAKENCEKADWIEYTKPYYSYYYEPNIAVLSDLINEIESYYFSLKADSSTKPSLAESRKAGHLLEKISVAVFHALKGNTAIKSYQSAGPQYDLLVSGKGSEWDMFFSMLPVNFSPSYKGILIEAKATKDPIPDKQFARLCSILDLNLCNTVGLGIFLTLCGASGFPDNPEKAQRVASDSRLRQLLFYTKTNKIIVVLDINDIRQLLKKGSLIEILIKKIQDIEELTGFPTTKEEDVKEVRLPKHLKEVYNQLTS